jgi:lysylphosphatidylglycerol synthetase-like protein (DUF2156 family)
MSFFNTSTALGGMLYNISEYVLGEPQLLGVWMLVLFLGFAAAFKIDFNITIIILVPLVVAGIATGTIYNSIGVLILITVALILGRNFLLTR